MSHVKTNDTIITDCDVLRQVIADHFPQLQWREGQKTWGWFGEWVKDYHAPDAAYKNGIRPEQYGHGDHAIHMPGNDYEIGVIKRDDGKGWSVVWDFWGQGRRLSEAVGDGAEKLMVLYNQAFVKKQAMEMGMTINETVDEKGDIYMELTQY